MRNVVTKAEGPSRKKPSFPSAPVDHVADQRERPHVPAYVLSIASFVHASSLHALWPIRTPVPSVPIRAPGRSSRLGTQLHALERHLVRRLTRLYFPYKFSGFINLSLAIVPFWFGEIERVAGGLLLVRTNFLQSLNPGEKNPHLLCPPMS